MKVFSLLKDRKVFLSFSIFLFFFQGFLFCKESGFKKPQYKPKPYQISSVLVKKQDSTDTPLPEKKAIYAVMETSRGTMTLELYYKDAPLTVQNFIDLAQGEKITTSPEGKKEKKRFYDGLTFHRVIPNFMIQGGCPRGDGTGNPGYRFDDEINASSLGLDRSKLREFPSYSRYLNQAVVLSMGIKSQAELTERMEEADRNANLAREEFSILEILHRAGYRYNDILNSHKAKKGSLAMANSGPDSNGSQFFINQVDTPHLDGLHTVFGELVSGFEVLEAIVAGGNSSTTIQRILIIDKR